MPGEFYLLEVLLRLLQGQEGHQGQSLLPLEGSRSIPGICCGISQAKPFFRYFFKLFPPPDSDEEPKSPAAGPFSTPISDGLLLAKLSRLPKNGNTGKGKGIKVIAVLSRAEVAPQEVWTAVGEPCGSITPSR